MKVLVALSFLVLLGLPILDLWSTLVLLAAWLMLACGAFRITQARLATAVILALFTLSLKSVLPRAAIEEGHNIFLITDQNDVLKSGLPPALYEKWRLLFERLYPRDKDPTAPWHQTPPLTLYADSSDALWRPAKYSRQVDAIAFHNLTEFRGGFANDIRYNFFGADAISLTRGFEADLPFFVMYEFSPSSVGSTLYWRGTVFWERADGSFEETAHEVDAGRAISTLDIGRRVYALHLPAPLTERFWEKANVEGPFPLTALAMHLSLRPGLAAARLANELLGPIAIFGVVLLVMKIHRRPLLVAIGLTAVTLVVIGLAIHFSQGKYLGPTYPPQGAGDDGLTHDSIGRTMARDFMTGHWKEALRGGQDIYWDTPGMRYVRLVEKVMFGDTNNGYLAFVALLPWFLYLCIRGLAGARWALIGAIFFFLSPLGSLSFMQYVQNAKLGYAEAMAFGLFFLGFFLLTRLRPLDAFWGGASLAGAMFVRPNLAIAVPVAGSFFLLAGWRSRDFKTMAALAAGLALALWMPVHNYAYGRQLVLISASGGSAFAVPLGPTTYLQAAREIVGGHPHGGDVTTVTTQATDWLLARPRLPVQSLAIVQTAFLALRLITLAVTIFAAFRYLKAGGPRVALAWAALAAHLPMLFIFAPGQYRYAMIAWDLCAVVTLVVIADLSAGLACNRPLLAVR